MLPLIRALSFVAALAAVLPAVSPVHAQSLPQDTLDWHRYFPLAVGNAWEYRDAEALGIFNRYDLEADTTVGGRQYFRRAHRFQSVGDTIQWTTRDYVRYDTSGVVVAVSSPAADTAAVDPCGSYFSRDLRLGFGARVACPSPPPDSVFVEGEYGVVWVAPDGTPLDVAAEKTYFVDGLLFTRFVADIGPVSAGNLWGPRLHYVRVGGLEYGTPQIVVSAEPPPQDRGDLALHVWPNPTRGKATLSFELNTPEEVTVAVYDVLGRRVAVLAEGPYPAGRHALHLDGSDLPAGVYLVHVTARASVAGHRDAQRFIVAHR